MDEALPSGPGRLAIPLAIVFFALSYLGFTQPYRIAGPAYRDDFNVSRVKGCGEGLDLAMTLGAARSVYAGGRSGVPYPPLTIAAYVPLTFLPFGKAYALFNYVLIAGLFLAVFFSLRENPDFRPPGPFAAAVLLTVVFYHSHWFQFELERGNSNIIAGMLSAAGLFLLSRGSVRASVVILVLAAQWRVYPAILGLVILSRAGLRPFALFIALNVAALFALGPANLWAFVTKVRSMSDMSLYYWPNHSLKSFLHESNLDSQLILLRTLLIVLGFAIFGLRWAVMERRSDGPRGSFSASEVGVIGVFFQLMELLPSVSCPYKLGIQIVPFLLFVTRSEDDVDLPPAFYLIAVALLSVGLGFVCSPAFIQKAPGLLACLAVYAAAAAMPLLTPGG